ncbi:hypothetical protein Dsin_020377 [Dipteronia sinensis]|uniref:Protein kinase domain-containing protein n=1 Tax=Dipteronia sinensis TaxID=43782 RepID=A0AAE0A958_9ROSI|nr:hypothetical protein Dsin_020377 [Dipteronia sinensis]
MPLLSTSIDLSQILLDTMYVGFSAATGIRLRDHYILGWSFNKTGQAQNLDIKNLPPLPKRGAFANASLVAINIIIIVLIVASVVVLTTIGVGSGPVTHDPKQGMKEFVAEIASMGRLRHGNLVQLRGYCKRTGELLLVYDYMPNGSLDKTLYSNMRPNLNWFQRFGILRGVASGLLYLHEEGE